MHVCVKFSKSPAWQSKHMWTVTHSKCATRERGVDKQRVWGTEDAIPRVYVPENVKHRLHSSYRVKKFRATCVIFGAGLLIENAIGRPVSHQHICVAWYS